MKTRIISKAAGPLVLALGMALNNWAWATHNPTHAEQQRSAGRESDRGPTWSDAVQAPLRGLGKMGTTVRHTPSIIGETFRGERKFISRNGLFARSEAEPIAEKTHRTPASEDHASSINQGRGSRLNVRE